jgi:AraC-like DNA-binding protein
MLETRRLHAGRQLAIHDVRCGGRDTPPTAGEHTTVFQVILPRHGLYLFRMGRRDLVANANHACLIDPGREYRVTHPIGGCDSSTAVSLSRGLFRQLLADIDATAVDRADDRLAFPGDYALVAPATALRHHALLRRLENPGTEALAVEESALLLCREVALAARAAAGRQPHAVREGSRRHHRERVEAVAAYLARHLARPVTLEELSRAAAMSPFQLARVFRAVTGLPIHRYRTRLRLLQALDRLREGALNLSEVALEAGFSSHSHFTTTMRAEFGRTPSDIRRLLSRARTAFDSQAN